MSVIHGTFKPIDNVTLTVVGLPESCTFEDNGDGTCTIGGTFPEPPGTYIYQIIASNEDGTYTLENNQIISEEPEMTIDEIATELCSNQIFKDCIAALTAPSTHTVTSAVVTPTTGEEGTTFCWSVTVDKPVTIEPLRIPVSFAGGRMKLLPAPPDGGSYYTEQDATLIIHVGDTEGQICGETQDDVAVSGDYTVTATFSEISRIPGWSDEITANVTENDSLEVTFMYVDINEFDVEEPYAEFDIYLNSPAPEDLTLALVWSGDGYDQSSMPESVTITEGSVSAHINVAVTVTAPDPADTSVCLEIHDQTVAGVFIKGHRYDSSTNETGADYVPVCANG